MPFHKKLFRGVVGAVRGFVSGGPLGALEGGFRGVTRSGRAVTAFAPVQPPAGRPPVLMGGTFGPQGPDLPSRFPGTVPEPGFRGGLQRFLPGGQTGYTGAPPGYHVNKAYLRHLRAQEAGRQTQNPFNEQRAVNVIVRNRKMNPLNPRALRLANARQVGAVRLMRRVLRGTGYSISRGGFGRKKTRRR